MRTAFILIIIGIIQAHTTGVQAQTSKLSLNIKNMELSNVLSIIESETGFFFLYNETLVDPRQKVSINAEAEPVDSILNKIFSGSGIAYYISDRKIILAPEYLLTRSKEDNQAELLTGVVTDAETGEFMQGVNVWLKNSAAGTITGTAGEFTLSPPDGTDSMLFSFVGYVSLEVPVTSEKVFNITLVRDVLSLDEVIVVGYGSQRKETLSGSVAAIRSEDIVTTRSTSVASSIQGKIPGVMIRQRTAEPGTFSSLISVRGFGSPLLVIDGVARDDMADFERLNPEDIESISVLKDASAAIFGMNADNGVVIVTTRRGIAGKTKLSYSSIFTLKEPTTTDRQMTVPASTYVLMKNEMDRNTGTNQGSPPTYSDVEIEKWRLGSEPGYQDYNWYRLTLSPTTTQQHHNFSISGGNNAVTFYTSLGYLKDNGLFTTRINYYDKYTFRTNIDARISNGLNMKISVAGKYDFKQEPQGGYFWLFKGIITASRMVGPFTLNYPGRFAINPTDNRNNLARITEEVSGYQRTINTQYQTTIDLNYDLPFAKGLSVGIIGAYDGNVSRTPNLNKFYYLYDYETGEPGNRGMSTYQERITDYNRRMLQTRLSFRRTTAGGHNISGTLVHEMKKTFSAWVQGKRQYDNLYTHDVINQGSTTNQTTAGTRTEEAFMSYLGRLNYDFKRKYLLEFSFRHDGSYRYSPDKRWAFFPAGSAGWRVSEESFFKNNLSVISNLKLRGSYGKMGSDAGIPFQYIPGYSFSNISGGYVFDNNILTLGMIPPGVVNNYLSWVSTATTDIGVDLDLWNGKAGITFDWFRKYREGLLSTRASAVPNTFGTSFPQENLNSDVRKGYELELSHRNRLGRLEYNVSANVTYSRLYRLDVEMSPYRSTWQEWKNGSDGGYRIQNRRWMYLSDGQYQDRTEITENAPLIGGSNGNSRMLPGMQIIKDVNNDGIINSNDQLPAGWTGVGANPPLHFGLSGGGKWMNFDFNILFQGSALFMIERSPSDVWGYGNFPVLFERYMDRWRMEDPLADPWDPATTWNPGKFGPLTSSKEGTTMRMYTDMWYTPADYLRIKSVELGYTLPKNGAGNYISAT
jgi:TonB-linked SusC/RagA family outer membrane protein